MDVEARMALIGEVGEEIVTEEELRALLTQKPHPVAYDGFEPSGTIHIAQGILRAINVNKMTRAGVRFKMFVADWHAWANNKMGGDLDKIQTTGRYIQEIWKSTGMDLANVEFVWASEFVADEAYWKKVMNVARDSSLDRILRTTQIMGRSDKDKLSAAQILYPCMQAADIFHLKADITQLGMDQRKVNMLAREVGPKLGFWKPVVVSHHMMMGLQVPPAADDFDEDDAFNSAVAPLAEVIRIDIPDHPYLGGSIRGKLADLFAQLQIARISERATSEIQHAMNDPKLQHSPQFALIGELYRAFDAAVRAKQAANEARLLGMKMSKSNPDSAIFMTDTPEQVTKKLNKAFCPEKTVEENPVLEYFRYIIFQRHWANHKTARPGESPVTIERPEKFGGNATYDTYAALAADYAAGKVHPADLKKCAARYLNEILQPVREHFEKDAGARALQAQVESFKVTR
jgi:tyrosyl-tRNA synthetase